MLLDTTGLAETDAARADTARLRTQLAQQAAAHAVEILGYREQAQRDLADLVTAQLDNDRLIARLETAQTEIDNMARRLAWLAPVDESEAPEGFWSGPTPANRKFVDAMANMDEYGDAPELVDDTYPNQAEADYRGSAIGGCQ